jgi:hypothetical protein
MLATKKSAGGLGSSHQLFAIKSVPKEDVSATWTLGFKNTFRSGAEPPVAE